MKKVLSLLVFTLLITSVSNAQFWKLRRVEVGGGLGTTQFFGDIGGFSRGENLGGLKDFTFRQTRYNLNVNGRYRIVNDLSARLNLTYGRYHSTDVRGSNTERGFESATNFFEIAAIGEFYFLKNRAENSFLSQKGKQMPFNSIIALLDCYAFTGFGVISYSVKPNDLLSTKISQTKGTDPVIPIGVGVNFNFSPDINFGAELGGRYAFTDHLEGYTSPYSEKKDKYFFFNLSVIYKIRTGAKNNPSF